MLAEVAQQVLPVPVKPLDALAGQTGGRLARVPRRWCMNRS